MLITIVIPCHNAAAFVERAIISCLRQEGVEIEIIAVENNSTDNTYAVLQTLAEKHPSKLKVVKEKKSGASVARNCGWRMGEGKYIQFLDADDELLPGKLLRQLKLIEPGGIVLGTPLETHMGVRFIALTLWDDVWKGLGHVSHCGQTSANLYHRAAIEMVNGWDESVTNGQDTDLLLRLLQKKVNVVLDKTPASVYHNDAFERITTQNKERALYSHSLISIRLIQYLKKNKIEYWKQNQQYFYLCLYHHVRMLACYDPVKAQLLFDQYLPIKFRIEANKSLNIPYWDALFVNMLGLKRFATLKNNLKRFVPDSLWRAMKFYLNKIGFRFLQNPE
ncbi:MAG: glycosyltransferase family 2 protein [Lewinella sp.]|uniref:glycosyltransferase family 2 protein n=1 Tax=Lewinella sp. TaxID=2004506 RepID=UPI003D6A3097